ncbi:hypothetical protein CTB96_19695 [Cryobacterium arcticum]|uniref:Uncharacterized protein n=1 Tax=Cryobacterium arcticum TaxID=670052 RepID=A0A317ZJQ5_9MICO|nr:hypothetical protein CTB96_19695 [Cryobacterium arcticum]
MRVSLPLCPACRGRVRVALGLPSLVAVKASFWAPLGPMEALTSVFCQAPAPSSLRVTEFAPAGRLPSEMVF